MYASVSWKPTDWRKLLTWVDRELESWKWVGSPINEKGVKLPEVIEDKHVMFALEANQSGSEITITPMEREAEIQHIKINKGTLVYVGNGFLSWDTDNEVK